MQKKFITFSNYNILSGSGHFNRCNILISKLSRKKDRYFYTVEETNFLYEIKKIYNKFKVFKSYKEAFHQCILLSKSYNLILLLDVYNFPNKYIKKFHKNGIKIIQFDNQINKKIFCDYYINYSPGIKKKDFKTENIINKNCRFFLGPRYYLLRRSIIRNRKKRVNKSIKNIMICFGASNYLVDKKNFIISILNKIDRKNNIYFFSKKKFDYFTDLKKKYKNLKIFINKDISRYVDKIDLSIISGGSLVFECIYNGIPVHVINISDNQVKISKNWKKSKIIEFSTSEYYKTYLDEKFINFLRLSYIQRKRIFNNYRYLLSNNLLLEKLSLGN
tara:strand:- start:910 stop:1905 length:996 start_codon:yes stop_codon:yes gene_type:complete